MPSKEKFEIGDLVAERIRGQYDQLYIYLGPDLEAHGIHWWYILSENRVFDADGPGINDRVIARFADAEG